MGALRTAVRAGAVAVGVVATTVAGPVGRSAATVSQAQSSPIASVRPTTGEVVGVAHPVVVTLRAPVVDRHAAERALNITSVPSMTGKFEWLDNEVVHWVPDRFWPAHDTVALSVGGVRTEFKTGPAVVGVASNSGHTFTVTIDGVDAGAPAPLPTPHHRPHMGEAGVLPASLGKAEFPTPAGTYSVLSKDRSVVMDSSSVGIPVTDPDGYRIEVDHAIRISNGGLYVHSAPWADRALGVANTSHGCISLSSADAEWYFDKVNVGDPVIVRD
jgi:lipoprotein-anchoring transpeptidase ErfK/SrfK